ncbi:MAG: Sjogren's syndrome/scleroderma autoantigen 1 family protein [Candidatus Baldrarchaeia archaeon]
MTEDRSDAEKLARMVDLLRAGAVMLSETCPVCHSPLFKVGGDVYCPSCQKKVVIVKRDEEATVYLRTSVLTALEESLIVKIQELGSKISRETDMGNLYDLMRILVITLEALEKIKRIKG